MLEVGKQIGDYKLLGRLGAGGFGEVWKAEKRTPLSVSQVALKFFRPKDTEEVEIEKVKKEIETWQSLSGLSNIISVIEANQFEDYVYIVSEFADGGSLDKWIASQPDKKANTIEEAVKITKDILKGLEQMHKLNFVHRDLKPANVLIRKGLYCLADFGVSRKMKTHSKATGTAGTFEYMSPEAFDGKPTIKPQTDIWAAGVILQELLTGKLPFPQEEIPSLMASILYDEPQKVSEDIPLGLREIIKKALQKDEKNRFQTAREMIGALDNLETFSIEDSTNEFKADVTSQLSEKTVSPQTAEDKEIKADTIPQKVVDENQAKTQSLRKLIIAFGLMIIIGIDCIIVIILYGFYWNTDSNSENVANNELPIKENINTNVSKKAPVPSPAKKKKTLEKIKDENGNTNTNVVDKQSTEEIPETQIKEHENKRFGVTLIKLTEKTAKELDIPSDIRGVLITNVEKGSVAFEKGIKKNDVILELNRELIDTPEDIDAALEKTGDKEALLLISRKGKAIFISIVPKKVEDNSI